MTRRPGHALDSARRYTESDLRLVGGEPTRSQCRAGAEAGNVSAETARRVYLAMIEADELSGAER